MPVHGGYAATFHSTGFRFTGTDGLSIACARRDSRGGPARGVIHLAHCLGAGGERDIVVLLEGAPAEGEAIKTGTA